MAVRNWHPGKLGLCWVVGIVLIWMSFNIIGEGGIPKSEAERYFNVTVLVTLLLTPIALFVLTWKWFSGREK